MDLRLQTPFNAILAGPTQSGKTTFVLNLLRNIDHLFDKPECQKNIIYYYKEFQPSLESFKDENIVHQWVNQMPTVDNVKERTLMGKDSGGSIVIIDDFAGELTKDIVEIFTVTGHHHKACIILLCQNLFQTGPFFRTISLNSTYMVVFKNPRDSSQISHFAKQFAPGNGKWIIQAFKEATKRPYTYIFFDNHQSSPEHVRVRSNILPHEAPMKVWMLNK